MADSIKGRAPGRRVAATPARYREQGHLGAAAGEGGDSTALEMVGFLEKYIAKIRTEMAEWGKSPL
ncbi:unnamed protein product [Ectocarpus sp. CCAP 1310/34]|nr:unnamed protein product [Ectocarpus sp. CCAP 1310/34]